MADKRKKQNVDPMQSIFDFIFAQTQKEPEKRKPIRYSNIHGGSELTDVLTSVLERPGLHVTDQAMSNLSEALNIQLAEVYSGTGAPQQKTKIKSNDLISIFKDPEGYFNKLSKKNKRKMKLADFAGKSYRGILAASTAKKLGIDDWDDRWAINRMAADYDDPAERLAIVKEAKKLGNKYLVIDSFLKGTKTIFGPNPTRADTKRLITEVGKRLDGANIQNETELRNFLRADPDFGGNAGAIDTVVKQYNIRRKNFLDLTRGGIGNERELRKRDAFRGNTAAEEVRRRGGTPAEIATARKEAMLSKDFGKWEETLHKGFKDRLSRFSPENIDMGKDIANKYFGRKGKLYEGSNNPGEVEKGKAYREMSLLMLNLKNTKDNQVRNAYANLRKVKADIKTLKSLPALTPLQRNQLDQLKKNEKGVKSKIKYLNQTKVIDNYYQVRGYWDSMKNVWGKNLGASIMDGSFFSSDNTILNPVNQGELGIHNVGKDMIFFNINAKEDKYSRVMTNVMYLTPKNLLKFNGQYFAYRAYRNRMNSFNKILSQLKNYGDPDLLDMFKDDITSLGLFSFNGNKLNINYDAFSDPTKLRASIDKLKSKYGNDPNISKMLDIYLKREGTLSKLIATFSIVSRLKENIKRKIDQATIGKIRGKIADSLLRRFGGNPEINSAIQLWKNGGGVQNLMKGFVNNFLKKMGFKKMSFTFLSSVLTNALSGLAFKFYMFLGKVAVVALIGLFIVLGLGASFASSLMQKYSPVSHVEPGEVLSCQGFEPEGLVNPGSDLFNSEVQPAPSNSTCPIGERYVTCSQGFIDVQGWSHQNIKDRLPVDLRYGGYISAPQYCDTSICTATYKGRLNCNSYAGDKVYLSDSFGNTMIMFHVAPVGVGSISSGESWVVKGGEAFARVQSTADGIILYPDGDEKKNPCWTGIHLHLEVTQNGNHVDPLEFLQSYNCNVPDESGCDDP